MKFGQTVDFWEAQGFDTHHVLLVGLWVRLWVSFWQGRVRTIHPRATFGQPWVQALWLDLFTPEHHPNSSISIKKTFISMLIYFESFIWKSDFEGSKKVCASKSDPLSLIFPASHWLYFCNPRHSKRSNTRRIMWRMTTPTATKHPAGHCVLDKSARIRLAQAADAVVKSFYKRLPPPSPQCIVALFVASMNVGIHSLRGY